MDKCLLLIAELSVQPPDVVEGGGLPGTVVGRPVVREAVVCVREGLLVELLRGAHPGQVLMGAGLSGVVAERAEQLEGEQVVGAGLVAPGQPVERQAESAVRVRLARRVALPSGGVQ
jgi:hypothetical protein